MSIEGFGGFRPKTKEELEAQVKKSQEILGENILPPDLSFEDTLEISNIQEKYKTRYQAYISSLRAERRGNIDTQEIKQAKEWIRGLNNLDNYIKEHESQDNPLLRKKQFIVYKKIRDFLEEGKRKGYIKLPTGTGKTVLFAKIAEALGMKTFLVAPTIPILNQNNEEVEKYTDSEFGTYYGGNKDLDKQVTNITYHSLVNAVKQGIINPDDIPVLILDEVHRSLGEERTKVVNLFGGLQLGFTATSEFSKDKKVSDLLSEEIFRMSVKDAIEEGLICRTQTVHAYTDVDISSVEIKKGKYDDAQIEKAVNVHGRNMAAIELYKNKFSDLKVFCNCSGVKHAQDLAELFNKNGVPAACITGDTPEGTEDEEGTRRWILKKYKDGEIKVLTNARVLLEGFNEPTCSVTFNLNPTLSLVDAEQRARSGRLDKDNPDKWNYVIDFIDKNSKKPQVLYSEILESDRLWDIDQPEPRGRGGGGGGGGPVPPIDLGDLNLDGLRIVTDTKTIMEVTNNNVDSREKWTYESLRADVLAKDVKTSSEYKEKTPENKGPSSQTLIKMPEFPKNLDDSPNWDVFFDREKKKQWTYETLRADVLAKGIKSSEEYKDKAPNNQWVSPQTLTSMPEFPKKEDGANDWITFLERKTWTYETLRADVLAKGIKSSEDYMKKALDNQWPMFATITKMPEFPKKKDGTNDWDTFLNKEKKTEWTYETLRADVLAKGIKSSVDYTKKAPNNQWPALLTLKKMPGFPKKEDNSIDWITFLERKTWTYETLRAGVLAKDVKTSSEYKEKALDNKWPSVETLVEMSGFPKKEDRTNDWDTFFNRKEIKNLAFEKLRKEVQSKMIKNARHYRRVCSSFGWPSEKTVMKSPEFKSWDNFLGKESSI